MATDLLTLMQADGLRLDWKSYSRGDQYNGPCPWCGGTDRFRVQPHHGPYGWFICNQCGKAGSAIDYLMLKRGLSKREALTQVGWIPTALPVPANLVPRSARQPRPQWQAPSPRWQSTALRFLLTCQDILWSDEGQHARAYLQQRGLHEQTIKEAMLGYYPREMTGSTNAWGRPVRLVRGIVIPWIETRTGIIWRVTIRREQVSTGQGRYYQVAGGSNGLYGLGIVFPYSSVVLVEGELDALSLEQTCGDLVTVVATGTTQGSHTPRWLALLAHQTRVLIAFDADEAGDQAAQWWLQRLPNARRLRPWWKDANQMLQDGADLRQWITSALLPPEQAPLLPDAIASICHLCGADVEYYDAQGLAYCTTHWPGERTEPLPTAVGSPSSSELPARSGKRVRFTVGDPIEEYEV